MEKCILWVVEIPHKKQINHIREQFKNMGIDCLIMKVNHVDDSKQYPWLQIIDKSGETKGSLSSNVEPPKGQFENNLID